MNYKYSHSPRYVYEFRPAPSPPQPMQRHEMVPQQMQGKSVRFDVFPPGVSHPRRNQQQQRQQPSYPRIQSTKANTAQPPAAKLLQHEDEWTRMFALMCEYKRYHGHCHIPPTCKVHPELAEWVQRQRLFMSHPRRVERLQRIGFAWTQDEAEWRTQCFALQQFQRQHGHFDVDSGTDLGTWMETQWYDYRKMVQGKRTSMTRDRVRCLQSIGFKWKVAAEELKTTTKSKMQQQRSRPVVGKEKSSAAWKRTPIPAAPDGLLSPERKSLIAKHCMKMRLIQQELYRKGKLPHLTKAQVTQLLNHDNKKRTPTDDSRTSKKSKKMRTAR